MNLLRLFDESQAKLSQVSRPDEIKDPNYSSQLSDMYARGGEYRPLATWLNATLTQRRIVQTYSQNILADLMNQDPSLKNKSLDGRTFDKFQKKLHANQIVKCLRNPTPFKDPITHKTTPKDQIKAGVYEVIEATLRAHLIKEVGQEGYERQLKSALELYDRSRSRAAAVTPSRPPSVARTSYIVWSALFDNGFQVGTLDGADCGPDNPPEMIEQALFLLRQGEVVEIIGRNDNLWTLKLLKPFPAESHHALTIIERLLKSSPTVQYDRQEGL